MRGPLQLPHLSRFLSQMQMQITETEVANLKAHSVQQAAEARQAQRDYEIQRVELEEAMTRELVARGETDALLAELQTLKVRMEAGQCRYHGRRLQSEVSPDCCTCRPLTRKSWPKFSTRRSKNLRIYDAGRSSEWTKWLRSEG